jgi:hypothetical protein
MEQSLISMTRFLKILERDLEMGDLSLQAVQTAKRIKGARKAVADGEEAPPAPSPAGSENYS